MKLEIRNATLGYNKKTILSKVDLSIETGEIVCVLGKNGAGKTTLFRSILGSLHLLAGEILIDGKRTDKMGIRTLANRIAYVPQARSLPFPFTVMDVVLFGRTPHLSFFSSPTKKDRIIAEECLRKLHILYLKDRIFTQLSGGEQQMVIVARALAQQPSFIIMDEPTSNLDFGNQIRIISKINELRNESLGILMATHSPDHAFMCKANVAVISDGTLSKKGFCNQVITPELLQNVYDTSVSVCCINEQSERKICVPHMAI